MYNPMTEEICINKDMVVNEIKSWDWTNNYNSLKE